MACSRRVGSSAVGSACCRPATWPWSLCGAVSQLLRPHPFSSALWLADQHRIAAAASGRNRVRAGSPGLRKDANLFHLLSVLRPSVCSIFLSETICLIFRTPLHLASANGHADVVRYLARKNCQLNLADNFKRTPLMKVSGLCSDLVSGAY